MIIYKTVNSITTETFCNLIATGAQLDPTLKKNNYTGQNKNEHVKGKFRGKILRKEYFPNIGISIL